MVTIKQIAQEVGISSSTVSIVLGGKAAERKISTATQEKIFAAAARLGYQPNMAARSLRGGSGANELVVALFWAQDFRARIVNPWCSPSSRNPCIRFSIPSKTGLLVRTAAVLHP